MGNTGSREREGPELFRYENKKIAKRLGFKNNLKVANHPLNKKQQSSKEPWSHEQKSKWAEDAEVVKKSRGHQEIILPRMVTKESRKKPGKMIQRRTKGKKTWKKPTLADTLDINRALLVVDIEKCSQFGFEHISEDNRGKHMFNFVSVELSDDDIDYDERLDAQAKGRNAAKVVLKEGKGWRHYNWLDSFNLAVFKLSPRHVSKVLDGYDKTDVKIRWGQGQGDLQKTIGVYRFKVTSCGCVAGNIRVKSRKGNIKFSYQIVDMNNLPSIGDFLPFSQ